MATAAGVAATRGGSDGSATRAAPAETATAAAETNATTTAAEPAATTTTAVLAAATEKRSTSRTLVAGGTALFPVPGDLASLVGHSARANRVRVVDVVGPRIFWVGPSRSDRMLVHLQGHGTRWAIRPGQLLSFTSIVTANRKGSTLAWGLTLREGARQFKRQGHHLEVFGPRIVFDRR